MNDTSQNPPDTDRPSWLTEPCPEWCVAKATHREEDLIDDRQHTREDQPQVILTDAHTEENEHRFSVDEAVDVAAALLHGVSIITDSEKVICGLERAYTVKVG